MTGISLASDVAWLDMANVGQDVVYATTLPDGPPVVLRGTAGVIFVCATPGGTVDDVVSRVSEEVDTDPDVVRGDVLTFVDHLVGIGLLVRG